MRKSVIVGITVAVVIVVWSLIERNDESSVGTPQDAAPAATPVTIRTVGESRSTIRERSFPGTVTPEAEARITASAPGTVIWSTTTLGAPVASGAVVMKISGTDSSVPPVDGVRSVDLFAASNALRSAKERLGQAQRDFDRETDSSTLRTARDVARNDVETSEAVYRSVLDRYLVRSPIAGTVTEAPTSAGDAVSTGSLLAVVSRGKPIVRFFVTADERALLRPGMTVRVSRDVRGVESLEAVISRIAPAAEPTSRRFLVEAGGDGLVDLASGTVVSIRTTMVETAPGKSFFLPLSAISQDNGTSVFVRDGETARRVDIEMVTVSGETAIVNADLPDDAELIIDGSKRIRNGAAVTVE